MLQRNMHQFTVSLYALIAKIQRIFLGYILKSKHVYDQDLQYLVHCPIIFEMRQEA